MSTPVKQRARDAKGGGQRSPFLPFLKLDRAAEIAYYYGFMPIKTPIITKDDISKARKAVESDFHERNYGQSEDAALKINAEEKIALLRQCEDQKILNNSQPSMVYYEGTPQRADHKKNVKSGFSHFNLDVMGTGKSVAEAELIKVTLEILKEKGFEDLYVDINSMGDKDSALHFTREVGQYYRKRSGELPSLCKTQMKKNPFAPLECSHEKCIELSEEAPKSVAFLSETSRLHFKEVLEYLESMHIPYKIDNRLIGDRRICCHTLFLIKTLNASEKPDTPEETLAIGYRYNALAKKAEMKRDVPAVGVTIVFKENRGTRKLSHKVKKPEVYFIQIGFDAKLKSLDVIEALRHEKIPLYQALAKDKLSSQIQTAENMGIPFVIIMGQKEALEGSVIVRDMKTRFQETVPLAGLATYLKKMR